MTLWIVDGVNSVCVVCGAHVQLNFIRRLYCGCQTFFHFDLLCCILYKYYICIMYIPFHFSRQPSTFRKSRLFSRSFAVCFWTADKLYFSFQTMLHCLFTVFLSSSPIFLYRFHFSFMLLQNITVTYAFCERILTTSPSPEYSKDSKDSKFSMSKILSFVHTCIHITKYFRICFYSIQHWATNDESISP